MVNVRALQAQMVLQGVGVGEALGKMGMSRTTWSRRKRKPGDFTVYEVSTLSDMLDLSADDKERIFFAK